MDYKRATESTDLTVFVVISERQFDIKALAVFSSYNNALQYVHQNTYKYTKLVIQEVKMDPKVKEIVSDYIS